jgi:drug/metabolite transporter (DMT)-like permease
MSSRNLVRLLAWMAGTLLSFCAVAVGVRELSARFSAFEILAARNAFGLALLVMAAAASPRLRAAMRTHRLGLHGIRNLFHFGATYAWALGLAALPLALVFALEFTTPILVALLATLLLGERLTGPRIGSIALGFVGVLVILRPGLERFDPLALVVLAAALGFAVSVIATKQLTRTDTTIAVLFWMNLMQLPLNLAGCRPEAWRLVEADAWLPLLGVCVGGFTSHLCLTNAYRYGDAILVVPLDFLRLPLIALVGWWLYAEGVDPLVFVGSAVIIGGILWSLRAETRPLPAAP